LDVAGLDRLPDVLVVVDVRVPVGDALRLRLLVEAGVELVGAEGAAGGHPDDRRQPVAGVHVAVALHQVGLDRRGGPGDAVGAGEGPRLVAQVVVEHHPLLQHADLERGRHRQEAERAADVEEALV
ncbi:MAG: hypothetical protein ACK55I_50170, partial [bacterium]